jgi:hypothetical protein
MTKEDTGALDDRLASLEPRDQDVDRAERLRRRCHAALAASTASHRRTLVRVSPRMELAAASGLATVYLVGAFASAIALYR